MQVVQAGKNPQGRSLESKWSGFLGGGGLPAYKIVSSMNPQTNDEKLILHNKYLST